MFGFLKKKLKDAVGKFTKTAEEVAEVTEEEADVIDEKSEITKEKDVLAEEKKEIKKEKTEITKKETIENTPDSISEKKKSEETSSDIPKEIEKKPDTTILIQEEKKPKEKIQKQKKEETKKIDQTIINDLDQSTKPANIKKLKKSEPEKSKTLDEKTDLINQEKESDKTVETGKDEKATKDEKKGFFSKIFKKKENTENKILETPESDKDEQSANKEKSTVFSKISDTITKISISDEKYDDLFWDIELAMLENNVAVEVIEKIKTDLKNDIVGTKIPRSQLQRKILDSLKISIEGLFDDQGFDLLKETENNKPFVIAVIGINGSGKTTTIAKLVHLFQNNKKTVVLGACDTFRAAAIQQLEEHAKNLNVKMIKHDYGADPAAVAFDTIQHAKAKKADIVLLDTAGRLHSNTNLMQELKKLIRISNPDMKIFVGESITGNDCVEQVQLFNESIGIDGIILSKADIDEKGGAAISVSYVTKKPILYIGTGQAYEDLEAFNKEKIISQLEL